MNSEEAKKQVSDLILRAEQRKKEKLRQLTAAVEFSEMAGKVQHLMVSVGTEFKPAAEEVRRIMAEIEEIERQKHYAKANGVEFEEEYVPVVGPSLDIPDGW